MKRKFSQGVRSDVAMDGLFNTLKSDRELPENSCYVSPRVNRLIPSSMMTKSTPAPTSPQKNLKLWSLEPRRSASCDFSEIEPIDANVSSPDKKALLDICSVDPCTPGSNTNFPSPMNKSSLLLDYSYQSPYWSNPVSRNPFSPIPLQHLTGLSVHEGTRNEQSHVSSLAPTTPPSGSKIHTECHVTPQKSSHTLFHRAEVFHDNCNSVPLLWLTPQRNITKEDVQLHQNYQTPLARSVSIIQPHTQPSRFNNDFQILTIIGRGSSGIVYKVLSRLDGCLYAVKMSKTNIKGEAIPSSRLREVHALSSLNNRSDIGSLYIVRYHQAWIEDSKVFFQTELCETSLRGELEKKENDKFIMDSLVRKCFHDITLAIDFIHKQGVVHMDIKPENIFLKDDKYKLGDFGLASKASGKAADEGDSRYMPLELLSDNNYIDLTKCDVFSLGATLYELGTGETMPADGKRWHEIRSGNLRMRSCLLHEVILKMMHPVPQDRPSAASLLHRSALMSNNN